LRNSRTIGRIAALATVLATAAVVAVVLLGGTGTDFMVKAASSPPRSWSRQPRPGRGPPVGEVTEIELTDDGQAEVELHHRPGLRAAAPGHPGDDPPGVAVGRGQPLRRPAAADGRARGDGEGDVIQQADTTTAVDLDQLFNVFDPESRKALQGFIKGQATSYGGSSKDANAGFLYLNPSLAATSRLFSRAQLRHAAAAALHRRELQPGHRRGRAPRRPRRAW
jgi:hypothetical protein